MQLTYLSSNAIGHGMTRMHLSHGVFHRLSRHSIPSQVKSQVCHRTGVCPFPARLVGVCTRPSTSHSRRGQPRDRHISGVSQAANSRASSAQHPVTKYVWTRVNSDELQDQACPSDPEKEGSSRFEAQAQLDGFSGVLIETVEY
jgi:hypothetical protein